jgi:hypothetical protein
MKNICFCKRFAKRFAPAPRLAQSRPWRLFTSTRKKGKGFPQTKISWESPCFHWLTPSPCRTERRSHVAESRHMTTTHGHHYKQLFAHAEIMRDLLIEFVPGPWVKQADFSTPGARQQQLRGRRRPATPWGHGVASERERRLVVGISVAGVPDPSRHVDGAHWGIEKMQLPCMAGSGFLLPGWKACRAPPGQRLTTGNQH